MVTFFFICCYLFIQMNQTTTLRINIKLKIMKIQVINHKYLVLEFKTKHGFN